MARVPVPAGVVAAVLLVAAAPLSCSFSSPFVATRSTTSTTRNIKLDLNCGAYCGKSRRPSASFNMVARQEGGEEAPAVNTGGRRGNSAEGEATHAVSRRGFFSRVATSTLGVAAVLQGVGLAPEEAKANGMLDSPPARLNNRYFLMRSGQGGSEKEGLIQSHPIDKLHMDNRLTDQGVGEAQRAAGVLRSLGVVDAFIWADISSRAQDTAKILAQELDIRQDKIVPEYAFLEPRGMGIFDGKEAAAILPQVYNEDAKDLTWRPPPNTDGTPNESVNDVFVRVRQLMSKLETQYQGEDVVIVGADSDCLSVLQSFVLGEEMGKHSKYYLRPGEGRQLRTSIDTEVGYEIRRQAKKESASASGWEGDGGGVEFAAASAPASSLAPPADDTV